MGRSEATELRPSLMVKAWLGPCGEVLAGGRMCTTTANGARINSHMASRVAVTCNKSRIQPGQRTIRVSPALAYCYRPAPTGCGVKQSIWHALGI
jgi:hypothetical protein